MPRESRQILRGFLISNTVLISSCDTKHICNKANLPKTILSKQVIILKYIALQLVPTFEGNVHKTTRCRFF
jgi:hypothetical protein